MSICLWRYCAPLILSLSIYAQAQQVRRPLITRPVDDTILVTLAGNTHPLAQPVYDIGVAPPNLPMNRMLLVLKRDPLMDHAIRTLLDDQQDKNSPNYHNWLTPAQFGAQFGPTDQDLQSITDWLQQHGFQINRISNGRGVIEFSGFESQVEQTFHTQIHQFALPNGEQHWANVSDPQIPAALAPAVAGIQALNNFKAKRFSHLAGVISRDRSSGQLTANSPLFTLSGNCGVQSACYGVGPYDFATIYDVASSWSAGTPIDGTGQTIAIVGETDINPQDVADFRNFFSLPAYGQPGGPALNILHNGPPPGISKGEESESDLDVQWSGAVAKGASIDFVVSQTTATSLGINLSALYIVDNNLAPVMSESYGFCELYLGSAGNQFFNSLWQQAAAQGITVMVSSGDGGSAGCDDFNLPQPASRGLQVSGFASTPYNVAVGGTDFNDLSGAAAYWSRSNNATTHASALSYIPETTWNDTCTNAVFGTLGFSTNAETNCNNATLINNGFLNIVGGSGGRSSCVSSDGQNASSCTGGYVKPSWQSAPGVPSDGVRDLPDISLYAASGSASGSFYVICESDEVSGSSCDPTNPSTQFLGIGGTSASAPAFAGVMALVNQKTGSRQGNANFVLYKLAQQAPNTFHDVTTGTIAVPCVTGSPNCQTNVATHAYGILAGYNAATGYDLATGLGSVDVGNLLKNWSTATFRASTTTLTLNPTSNLTHGQSVTVTGAVAPSSGSGVPSGNVALITSSGLPAGTLTLSNGAISGSTILLPGGNYTVTAHYAGDTVFGASDSTPVTVKVGKENSTPQIELQTFDWQGNLTSANAGTAVYGSPYVLRVDVLNSAGTACQGTNALPQFGCPTGSVALIDNGTQLDAGTYPLNNMGYTEDQAVQLPGGGNSVQAQYAGDNSFNASSATTSLNITPAPTTTSPPPTSTFVVGGQYIGGALVQSQSSGIAPSGTLTFYANGIPIPGTIAYSSNPPSGYPPTISYGGSFYSSGSPFTAPGNYNITVSYSGDGNYQPSTSANTVVKVTFAPPNINLQATPNAVSAGASTTLTAVIAGSSKTIPPTGTVSFYESSLNLINRNAAPLAGSVSYTTVSNRTTGYLDLHASLQITPAYSDWYAANYNGDQNYPSSNSQTALSVTVNGGDFTLVPGSTSATVNRGSATAFPLLIGFQSTTAPVSFGATACSGLPAEATCTVSPDPLSSLGVVAVTVTTTAPNRALAIKVAGQSSRPYLWLTSMLPLAAILLIGCRPRGVNHSLPRLLLIFLLLLGIACGGGGMNAAGGGGGGGGVVPAAPTGLTATAISSSQVNLAWYPSPNATSYFVYRSTTNAFTPSASNQIASTNQSSFYADSGLSPSTTYYYLLKASNSSGTSSPSNQASVSTQVFDPGTPAGTYNITVTATSGSFTHSVNLVLVVQ